MYQIYKITSNHVVDFAAEELKKYLRMMMPRCGEIDIAYEPNATDGFRLGLLSDFGLDTSEAADLELDDILHIDCDTDGGIIAGSNPRSVLLAVYRYLTLNGCRWLFPGIDGEFIPVKNIEAVQYHKMADCRYRGQCNEGAESQPTMMEAIDFTPKIGMNVFMIEFDIPKYYYDQYYNHKYNTRHREPEPITPEIILQWKRQCEVEMSKRGLQFHDMGHGWTAEAFGIDTTDGWVVSQDENPVPPENREFVAMLNGKRELCSGVALCTNFCMSNPDARRKVVLSVSDYAQKSTNVDYLHVWLADMSNNYCECDECQKMTPSDWYIILMNEIDEELTARNLKTRIVFISYVDTTWAPEQMTLKNPERFSLLVAGGHDYSIVVDEDVDLSSVQTRPFALNHNVFPSHIYERLAYGKQWLAQCPVPSFLYEYHFFKAQSLDLGVLDASRVVYHDVRCYYKNGFEGVVEDGTQRGFWPNGLMFTVYGQTLFDTEQSFDAMVEDYFLHAYGDDWKQVLDFFEKLGKLVNFKYSHGKCSVDPEKGKYYCPEILDDLRRAQDLVEQFKPFVSEHRHMPYRVQTVAYRLLARYLEFCEGVLTLLTKKCVGLGAVAKKDFYEFALEFGRHELEMESCYDHRMVMASWRDIFGKENMLITY